jgi:hypothetical protein
MLAGVEERTNFRIFFAQPSEQRRDTLGGYVSRTTRKGRGRKWTYHAKYRVRKVKGDEESRL